MKAAIPCGALLDRAGPRRALALASGIIVLFGLLRGQAGKHLELFLAVAVFGVGGPLVSDLFAEPDGRVRGLRLLRCGRDFTGKPPLTAPFLAVKVTGSLFHTQGSLVVNEKARAQRREVGSLPNLFAGGGAACVVSGPAIEGYLSGNGLLTAVTLGRIAGETAAALLAG